MRGSRTNFKKVTHQSSLDLIPDQVDRIYAGAGGDRPGLCDSGSLPATIPNDCCGNQLSYSAESLLIGEVYLLRACYERHWLPLDGKTSWFSFHFWRFGYRLGWIRTGFCFESVGRKLARCLIFGEIERLNQLTLPG